MATESPYWLIMGENGVSAFSWLLLIQSVLYLKVTRTCKKISDKFVFQPDRTTDYRVTCSCRWASKKIPIDLQWENGVSILASSFLIESSLKLLVNRTGIKARSCSILGCIRPLILELLALGWQKFHTFGLEYLWSQLANLDKILCMASLGLNQQITRERLHKVLEQIDLGTLDSGERSFPFGLLVYNLSQLLMACYDRCSHKLLQRNSSSISFQTKCIWLSMTALTGYTKHFGFLLFLIG